MEKYILIEGDYNDGDYSIRMTKVTDDEINLMRPVIAAIKENNGDYLNGEMAEQHHNAELSYGHFEGYNIFEDCTPNGDPNYSGIHNIESVKIVTILEELL